MFNWNHLETFVILSENLSFSETARMLNIAQPAISRQIRLMEESLGYPLFIRSRKSVILSPEGQQLKIQLAPLVDEIKKLFHEKQNTGSLLSGVIRIGSMQEAGQILLMPKIFKFLKMHPNLDIHTSLMSSSQVNEQVLKGHLDFGFVYRLSESKTLRSYILSQDSPVLIQSAKSKVPFHQRQKIELVGYREDDHYAKSFLSQVLSKPEQKKIQFRSSINSHSAMIQMVIEEDLLAVIPKNSASMAVAKNQIRIISENPKTHGLHLVCHEQILIDKKKKRFCDFLIEEFKKS